MVHVLALAAAARLWAGSIPDGADQQDRVDAAVVQDGDSLYHLHRVARTIAGSGRVPAFEPRLSYPDGLLVPWPPGYDLLVAGAAALCCGKAPATGCLARVAGWSTPLLGLGTTLLVLLLGRRLLGDWPALLAAALFAAYPFSVAPAALGLVDHHVAEPLLVAAWFIALAAGRPVVAGLIAGVAFHVFPAALVAVIATAGALLLPGLVGRQQTDASAARAGLWFSVVATVCLLPLVLWISPYGARWELAAPGRLHLLTMLFACFAGGVIVLTRHRGRPRLALPLLLCSGAVMVALAWPHLRTAGRFLAASEIWSEVAQQQSLGTGLIATVLLLALLSTACASTIVRARRNGCTALQALGLAGWALGSLGIMQIRFLGLAAPLLVVIVADVLAVFPRWLGERAPARSAAGRATRRALVAGVWLLALLPLLAYLRPSPGRAASMRDGTQILRRLGQRHGGDRGVAVLADWVWGHHVLYHAELAAVPSPFIFTGNDALHLAVRRALWTAPPRALYSTMGRHRARYLLVDRSTVPAHRFAGPAWSRLQEVDSQGTMSLYELLGAATAAPPATRPARARGCEPGRD